MLLPFALLYTYNSVFLSFFFFNDTATTEIYTLSLHDALPISGPPAPHGEQRHRRGAPLPAWRDAPDYGAHRRHRAPDVACGGIPWRGRPGPHGKRRRARAGGRMGWVRVHPPG